MCHRRKRCHRRKNCWRAFSRTCRTKCAFTGKRSARSNCGPVDLSRYFCREKLEPKQYLWIKTNGRLPDNYRLHQCALAYASDFSLLDTALIAHGRVLFDPRLILASLDHALWFHRPFRADEWLLYAQDSPSAQVGRGFCRGSIFSRDGRLVASTAQEGLIREKVRK